MGPPPAQIRPAVNLCIDRSPVVRSGSHPHSAAAADRRSLDEFGRPSRRHARPGSERRNQPEPSNRTRVAAGPGNRSQIREELPLSTRVHELAKELGLKSQELLERIQKWGLDVKANALASLDPPMVDRIRELMDQPATGKGADSPAAGRLGAAGCPTGPSPCAAGPDRRLLPGRLDRSRRPSGQSPARPGPVGRAPGRGRRAAGRSTRVRLLRLLNDWSPARPPPDRRGPRRRLPPRGRRHRSAGPRPSRPRRPRSRARGRFFREPARRRPALGAHAASRHGPAPGGPRGGQRLAQPDASIDVADGRPPGFQPLKPDDYMSSAGIRSDDPAGRLRRPSSAGPRRPGAETGRRRRTA